MSLGRNLIDALVLAKTARDAQANPDARRLRSTIIVGYTEKHEVTYDQSLWDAMQKVYVDGVLVVNKRMAAHLKPVQSLDLMVGVGEQHRVKYEYEANVMNNTWGPITLRVFVDDWLIETKVV